MLKRQNWCAAVLATAILAASTCSAVAQDDDTFDFGGMECGSIQWMEDSIYGDNIEVTNFILSEEQSKAAHILKFSYTVVNRSEKRANAYIELLGISLVDDEVVVPFVFSDSILLGLSANSSESANEISYSFEGSRLDKAQFVCMRVVTCFGCLGF